MSWGRVAVGGRPAGVATSASFSGVRWSCDDVLVKEFVRIPCGIRIETVGLF